MSSMYETIVEKVYCKCSNPCLYYHRSWNWFQEEKISQEMWDKYTLACLEKLMKDNQEILDRLKKI